MPTEEDPALYGDSFADVYDEWYREVSDVDATVRVMRALAGDGAVLELGVGTGRLAIPLAKTGVPVTGVDSSWAMLERLRANDHEGLVRSHLLDMTQLGLVGGFSAAFVAYNTLFNLTSLGTQQACFKSVAAALDEHGAFVVEAFVPGDEKGAADRNTSRRTLDDGTVVITATIRNPDTQVVTGQHIEISRAGHVKLRPWKIRYSTVAELDELAALAGFSLLKRWNDWAGRPFADESSRHVTIYQRNTTP